MSLSFSLKINQRLDLPPTLNFSSQVTTVSSVSLFLLDRDEIRVPHTQTTQTSSQLLLEAVTVVGKQRRQQQLSTLPVLVTFYFDPSLPPTKYNYYEW